MSVANIMVANIMAADDQVKQGDLSRQGIRSYDIDQIKVW